MTKWRNINFTFQNTKTRSEIAYCPVVPPFGINPCCLENVSAIASWLNVKCKKPDNQFCFWKQISSFALEIYTLLTGPRVKRWKTDIFSDCLTLKEKQTFQKKWKRIEISQWTTGHSETLIYSGILRRVCKQVARISC